ncbi:MAG: HEAT repeat domain-containing protein [Parachlamydiaceae bacterium]|nr:HEAT repeat domain-containing protein [Parachlamydiaceae bacterium]
MTFLTKNTLSNNIFLFFFLVIISISPSHAFAQDLTSQKGKILFLIQQGSHSKAIDLYKEFMTTQGSHDFELLHQLGLGIVQYGSQQRDPEIQLFSLFGASISAHDDTYHVLEDSLSSPYPQIQLIALHALCRFQNNRSDRAISQALSSNHAIIRLEAVHQMCKQKHPQAVAQTESLMYKVPKEMLPIFPQLFAMVASEQGTRLLRKLLNDPSDKVRIAAILAVAKYNRDDLLPQIRQSAIHLNYSQQEAAAYALGELKDEQSTTQLNRLANSQFPNVKVAAQLALYRLGQKEIASKIMQEAKEGNLFAIATLGEIHESAETLTELLSNSNLQVRVNATLALLEIRNKNCFLTLKDLIIRHKHDLAFTETASPGNAMKTWKAVSSASQVLKDDVSAFVSSVELRETILSQAFDFSEPEFLKLAEAILSTQQNDLISSTILLLQDDGSKEAVALLNKYHQKIGAPIVRNYCNLALYRMKEPGPYGDNLRQWVKSQNKETLIQFEAFNPWEFNSKHELTPVETSRLLIEAFEAFAVNQDDDGINSLLEAIQSGNEKNKYALAGLLIRATQ